MGDSYLKRAVLAALVEAMWCTANPNSLFRNSYCLRVMAFWGSTRYIALIALDQMPSHENTSDQGACTQAVPPTKASTAGTKRTSSRPAPKVAPQRHLADVRLPPARGMGDFGDPVFVWAEGLEWRGPFLAILGPDVAFLLYLFVWPFPCTRGPYELAKRAKNICKDFAYTT